VCGNLVLLATCAEDARACSRGRDEAPVVFFKHFINSGQSRPQLSLHLGLQALSSFSSLTLEEVADLRGPDQALWFQLYVNKNRTKTEELIVRADKYAGLWRCCILRDEAFAFVPIRTRFSLV
jgi:hypothetical protein